MFRGIVWISRSLCRHGDENLASVNWEELHDSLSSSSLLYWRNLFTKRNSHTNWDLDFSTVKSRTRRSSVKIVTTLRSWRSRNWSSVLGRCNSSPSSTQRPHQGLGPTNCTVQGLRRAFSPWIKQPRSWQQLLTTFHHSIRGSSAGISTRQGLDSPWIKSHTISDRNWGPPAS